ncbi:hypothetical protein EZS27_010977 [termite gut metagenome]|uniref:Uncharacterized protein n=1 Tax=termite gut metagenome TaxID=433724 RepID=A0A5J4S5T8_9ZZZZ
MVDFSLCNYFSRHYVCVYQLVIWSKSKLFFMISNDSNVKNLGVPLSGRAIRYNAFVRILTKAFSLVFLWFMQAHFGNLFHKICYFLSRQTSDEPVWL